MRRVILPSAIALLATAHATPVSAAPLSGGFTGSFLLTFFFFASIVAVAQFVHRFLLLRGRIRAVAEEKKQQEAAEQ